MAVIEGRNEEREEANKSLSCDKGVFERTNCQASVLFPSPLKVSLQETDNSL